jgi:HK97 family phage prohead protease
MLLRKTLSLSEVTLKMDGEAGRFSGYASVWGNVDADNDIIVRGAFDYTLRTHGKPKMFFNHDWGSIPVGKWLSAKEDDHGLIVEGEFTPGLAAAEAVRAAMKHGTLDGLSVGGMIKTGDWEETEDGKRLIRRWTRLVEISPVVFPANSAARIDMGSVKGGAEMLAAIEDADTIREIEQLLRDAAGLTKGAATALVARVKALAPQGEPADTDAQTMQAIQQRLARLTG